MLTIDQVQEELDMIYDDIPPPILEGLNGGIILLPDTLFHPQSARNDYYILGQYHYEPLGFGRYITIYYGSFRHTYGHLPRERQVEKLKDVLFHELTHHLEHLAGDRSLEEHDAMELAKYLRRRGGKSSRHS